MLIFIGYSDGQYFWRQAKAGDTHTINVPDSTVKLWEEISNLTRAVNTQLRQLDEEIFEQDGDHDED